jgi:hypothetical protein
MEQKYDKKSATNKNDAVVLGMISSPAAAADSSISSRQQLQTGERKTAYTLVWKRSKSVASEYANTEAWTAASR